MILENGEVVLFQNAKEFQQGRDLLIEHGYKFHHGISLMKAMSGSGMRYYKEAEYPKCIATLSEDMLKHRQDGRLRIGSEGWYDIICLTDMLNRLHKAEVAVEDLI